MQLSIVLYESIRKINKSRNTTQHNLFLRSYNWIDHLMAPYRTKYVNTFG